MGLLENMRGFEGLKKWSGSWNAGGFEEIEQMNSYSMDLFCD
jgi:hypothetical protein